MGRRHYLRSEPPPVAELRDPGSLCPKCSWVPDVARDKGVKLSRGERQAIKAHQASFFSDDAGRQSMDAKREE